MTFRISRKIEIDYGHTLPNHYGFCSEIHGHRAKIVACVEGELKEEGSDAGMVFDFKHLKDVMYSKIHDELDHGFAVWREDDETRTYIESRNERVVVTEKPPTAEVLARWAYNQIKKDLPSEVTLVSVEWHETPNNRAKCKE